MWLLVSKKDTYNICLDGMEETFKHFRIFLESILGISLPLCQAFFTLLLSQVITVY